VAEASPLTPLEFHVLVALTEGASYGYALMTAVEEQSAGRLDPDVGTLYRVLARLMSRGLVDECPAPDEAPDTHRGRPRRYYGLTAAGRDVAQGEARRMADLVDLARARALLGDGVLGERAT
jgi:DNA-binding PadR family transcriptional regulator